MWNMNFTVPTLIILAVITGAYMSRRHLPIRVSRAFGLLLLSALLTIVTDLASTVMDMNGNAFPDILLWFVNYLFFAEFLMRSFLLFWLPMDLFESNGLTRERKIFKSLAWLEQIFLLAGSLTGWIFSIHDGVYTSGPLYQFINIQFLIWVVIGFILLIRIGHSVTVRKTGVYTYLTVLFFGIIVRMRNPHVVIMNFFCMFAILIIYLVYMNPDQYVDDVSRLFNEKGWQKVLREIPMQENFHLVGFGIRNFNAIRETRGIEKVNSIILQIGEWISHTWPHLSTFYNGSGVFIIADTKPFDEESILHEIDNRFEMPWSADEGEYYISVNKIVMRPLENHISSNMIVNIMWDCYPLLTQADERSTIVVNAEEIHKQKRKTDIQKLLQNALNTDGLTMYLQPVVNTRNDHVEGAEALCRLKDEKGNIIYPDEFIPLAKQNGSIARLGLQMFRKACAFMAQEDIRFSNIQWVNVNVAPEQFRDPNLLDEFLSSLKAFHLSPASIHLEITEETMIDRTLLHDSMARFREKGFIFSMDDFGSSYSNMIRLQQNHFSNVKIDKDFTWSHFKNPTSLLPDIITTCHNLGMKVVTEGVENKEMADGVKKIHADYIQGYYYSKPISTDAFISQFVTKGTVEHEQH